jgi:Fe-Mn family superoxide dismutase
MLQLEPRSFPALERCDALSAHLVKSHLQLYAGYVKKYNELAERLAGMLQRGPGSSMDLGSLKGDLTFALGAIKNHELYFETLGQEGQEPAGELAALIIQSFQSIPAFLVDLKQTAQQARGWTWTAYDLDYGHLFNYPAGDHNGLPVWNAVPVLAIDLYGHAYFYDFGNNKVAYIEATMRAIDWQAVERRLDAARRLSSLSAGGGR